MLKTKWVQLLSKLSAAELREFSKYMEGTAYRSSNTIFLLLGYLKKIHPEFPEKKNERAYIKKILSKKDKKAGNRLADLNTFLSVESLNPTASLVRMVARKNPLLLWNKGSNVLVISPRFESSVEPL